jgi:hypothetical protein
MRSVDKPWVHVPVSALTCLSYSAGLRESRLMTATSFRLAKGLVAQRADVCSRFAARLCPPGSHRGSDAGDDDVARRRREIATRASWQVSLFDVTTSTSCRRSGAILERHSPLELARIATM